jgi:5-formyltetrahydrofolate cyclo-ligase
MPGELDVWPLLLEALADGKTVALPRYDPPTQSYIACRIRNPAEDVAAGYWGIREPNARCAAECVDQSDLILVPGVAFDLQGRRLGRGKGFYDRLLATVRGTTCGIAFDEQIVPDIPVEPHDTRLNCLLTPTRWREV